MIEPERSEPDAALNVGVGAPMTRREVPPSVAAAASAVSARKKPTAEPPGALPVDKIVSADVTARTWATSTRSPRASPRSGFCSLSSCGRTTL